MIESEKNKNKEQHKFPMTNFLSLALDQTPKCWFSSFFLRQQSKFSRSNPFFIPIRQSRKKIQEHTFFYVYCNDSTFSEPKLIEFLFF